MNIPTQENSLDLAIELLEMLNESRSRYHGDPTGMVQTQTEAVGQVISILKGDKWAAEGWCHSLDYDAFALLYKRYTGKDLTPPRHITEDDARKAKTVTVTAGTGIFSEHKVSEMPEEIVLLDKAWRQIEMARQSQDPTLDLFSTVALMLVAMTPEEFTDIIPPQFRPVEEF